MIIDCHGHYTTSPRQHDLREDALTQGRYRARVRHLWERVGGGVISQAPPVGRLAAYRQPGEDNQRRHSSRSALSGCGLTRLSRRSELQASCLDLWTTRVTAHDPQSFCRASPRSA
jgi:hypothetical protein